MRASVTATPMATCLLPSVRPFLFASVLAFCTYASASSPGSIRIQRLAGVSSPKLGQWVGSMNQGTSPNESPLRELICLATSLGILTRPRMTCSSCNSTSRICFKSLWSVRASHSRKGTTWVLSASLFPCVWTKKWHGVQVYLLEVLSLLVSWRQQIWHLAAKSKVCCPSGARSMT